MMAIVPALFAATALIALAAPAIAAPTQPSPLPMESEPRLLEAVPGVGGTPGIILEVQTPGWRCSQSAIAVANGLEAPAGAIRTCSGAITDITVQPADRAAAFVNRGVLLASESRIGEAKADFEQALAIDPNIAEALVNRGAILASEGRLNEALADLDRALALGVERPERAHFHRARVREELRDIRGAYQDYRAAATLAPTWEEPRVELTRFQVRRAAQ